MAHRAMRNDDSFKHLAVHIVLLQHECNMVVTLCDGISCCMAQLGTGVHTLDGVPYNSVGFCGPVSMHSTLGAVRFDKTMFD